MQVMTHHKMVKFVFERLRLNFLMIEKKVYFISLFYKMSKNKWFNKFIKTKEKLSKIFLTNENKQKQALRPVYVLINASDDEKLKRVYLMKDEVFLSAKVFNELLMLRTILL